MKRLLVFAVLLFLGLTQVNATDIRLHFNNVSPSRTVSNPVAGGNTSAGLFNWTQLAVSPGPAGILTGSGGLSTYCINLGQTLQQDDWYRVVTGIVGISALPNPSPSPAMGVLASQRLAILANELGGGGLAGQAGNHVAIQVAVWNITRGNVDYNVNDITGLTATQETQLETILDFIDGVNEVTYDYTNANFFVVALDSLTSGPGSPGGSGQDQIFFVTREQFTQIVPVPAGVLLSGIGVFCISGFSYMRRRKLKAVA